MKPPKRWCVCNDDPCRRNTCPVVTPEEGKASLFVPGPDFRIGLLSPARRPLTDLYTARGVHLRPRCYFQRVQALQQKARTTPLPFLHLARALLRLCRFFKHPRRRPLFAPCTPSALVNGRREGGGRLAPHACRSFLARTPQMFSVRP